MHIRLRRAFTLIEIIIASAVLSVFMTGIFSLYNSGSSSFMAGSWRLEEQQRAQRLLSGLRRDLGICSNGLYKITADGTRSVLQSTPIYVNAAAFSINKAPKYLNANVKKWTCLMAFSISHPYQAANPVLAIAEVKGKWAGASVWVKNRKIRYIKTGSVNKYINTPVGIPAGITEIPSPAMVAAGADFLPDAAHRQDTTYDLSTEEIAIVASGSAAVPSGLAIFLHSIRYKGTQKTNSELIQTTAVKLASMTPVVTF